MQDQPSRIELLQAVIDFLRQTAIPNLAGQPAFHARVASNVLEIVARELQLAAPAEAGELARLRVLLQEDGELEALNRKLCEGIASGDITLDTPGLAEHLWQLTLARVAIDQPGYATYRRILDSQHGA